MTSNTNFPKAELERHLILIALNISSLNMVFNLSNGRMGETSHSFWKYKAKNGKRSPTLFRKLGIKVVRIFPFATKHSLDWARAQTNPFS